MTGLQARGSAQYTVSLYRQISAMGAWIKAHTESEILFSELDLLYIRWCTHDINNWLKITNSMELSHSWEAVNCAATHFPTIVWNPKVHYSVLKSLHWFLSWARSFQWIPPHLISLRFILLLTTHILLGFPSGLLPSDFPTNILFPFFFSPIRATCPAHFIFLNLRRDMNEKLSKGKVVLVLN
jgi:hypothetical protein